MPPNTQRVVQYDLVGDLPVMQMSGDDENSPVGGVAKHIRGRVFIVGMLVGAMVGACIAAVISTSSSHVGTTNTSDNLELTFLMEEDSSTSELEDCGPRNFDWDSISSVDTLADKAVNNSLMLAEVQRKACTVPIGDFPFNSDSFLRGQQHTHYVHVHHKFDASCTNDAYKLSYYINDGGKPTSFVLTVVQDRSTKAWTLLDSKPPVCDIKISQASEPEPLSTKAKNVQDAAEYAVREVFYQMKKGDCVPDGVTGFKLVKVKSAVAEVLAGVQLHMVLQLKSMGPTSITKDADLIVTERCGRPGECIFQLAVKGGDVCAGLQPPTERRLQNGAVPEDPVNVYSAQKQMLSKSRRLSDNTRNPLMERHIQSGDVPTTFDPRDTQCYQKITVYNQGSCGSCFANAVAQMMGLRLCTLKAKGRRLSLPAELVKAEKPGMAEKAGLMLSKSLRADVNATTGFWENRQLGSGCADSSKWTDLSGDGCSWYARYDKGCKKYKDYGQRSHCMVTCGTCPKTVDQKSSENPWYEANYAMMPSVNDLAQCSQTNAGEMDGCDGGTTHGVWNNWMVNLQRPVWVMGEDCKPYTMKCFESSGIVNPLTGGHCSNYDGYQLWHKPCSCIPSSKRPTSLRCPRETPTKGCAFEVPPAMFIVKNVAHGLSIKEAVLNMQRHIAEFGPIYVAFKTTNAFMNWDWSKNPIYTGGSNPDGGHAVISVGWGTSSGTDYWILRNSWGEDWADKGNCYFKRGVNLDGIESRSIAASMPTASFKDWSPPVCRLVSSSRGWNYYGSKPNAALNDYTFTVYVSCNKKCSLKAFMSEKLLNRDQIKKGVSGYTKKLEYNTPGKEVALPKQDLPPLGFGLKTGDMWVKVSADDGKGNKATIDSFFEIPKVSGMVKFYKR
eukprot:gnl/MRDRNA2_/MRDRNA2_30158_c0_seq1.p1 gnl/MRDRNA2_/MRDRNA2_30158_c0~~gnl/MRDRNA2_/MRDRNA2_30158_c0_seq1.p1  ORF type:complete len:930 (+),score=153.31 gnl/MRDRNA2_/MRDRNA2_30158_c0_seq1:109-2790(+)